MLLPFDSAMTALDMHDHPVTDRGYTRALVGLPIDYDQAIGAASDKAEASPFVSRDFGGRERAHSRRKERRCDGVGRKRCDRMSIERHLDRFAS